MLAGMTAEVEIAGPGNHPNTVTRRKRRIGSWSDKEEREQIKLQSKHGISPLGLGEPTFIGVPARAMGCPAGCAGQGPRP